MESRTRREFLTNVGGGMLLASLGSALTQDLGFASAHADEGTDTLDFGKLEPLVALMQDTPVEKLLPALSKKLADGMDLKTLIAAGSLANARSFGGQDYTGYHALMALAPALQMSTEVPKAEAAVPVFKVLYRNTSQIQKNGGRASEVLHPVVPANLPDGKLTQTALQEMTRKADLHGAEQLFAAMSKVSLEDAYQQLLYAVQDEIDVHRVVLAWRSRALHDVTGREHASTLLHRGRVPHRGPGRRAAQAFLSTRRAPRTDQHEGRRGAPSRCRSRNQGQRPSEGHGASLPLRRTRSCPAGRVRSLVEVRRQ